MSAGLRANHLLEDCDAVPMSDLEPVCRHYSQALAQRNALIARIRSGRGSTYIGIDHLPSDRSRGRARGVIATTPPANGRTRDTRQGRDCVVAEAVTHQLFTRSNSASVRTVWEHMFA